MEEDQEFIHPKQMTKPITQKEMVTLSHQKELWEDLKACYGWKIYKKFPYYIRKAHHTQFLMMTIRDKYPLVEINCQMMRLHRLIAEQWIPNPEHLPVVDHIDGDTYNYHISNLRWVTENENYMNIHVIKGKKLDLLNDIPDSCRPLDIFKNERIDNLYIDLEGNHNAYRFNGILFKKLNKQTTKKGELIDFELPKRIDPTNPNKKLHGKKLRIYINEAIDIILNLKPQIINQTTTQGFNIEYPR